MEMQKVRQWVLQLSGFVLNQMQSENLITMEDVSKQNQAEWKVLLMQQLAKGLSVRDSVVAFREVYQ